MDDSPHQERPPQAPKVLSNGPHSTAALTPRAQPTGTGVFNPPGTGVFNPPITRAESWTSISSSSHRGGGGDGGRRGSTIHEDAAHTPHTPLGGRHSGASSPGGKRHSGDGRPMRRTGSSSALSSSSRDGGRDAHGGHGDRGAAAAAHLLSAASGSPPAGPPNSRRDGRAGQRRNGLQTSPSLPAMPVLPGSPTLPYLDSDKIPRNDQSLREPVPSSAAVLPRDSNTAAGPAVSSALTRRQHRNPGQDRELPADHADSNTARRLSEGRGAEVNGAAPSSTATEHAATQPQTEVVSPYMQMVSATLPPTCSALCVRLQF